MRHRGLAFVALCIIALAACSGGSGGAPSLVSQPFAIPTTPTPTTAPGSATVSFLIVVPPAGSSRTRPHVVVPSNATSVKFTIDSVNGTPYTGTPTTETLSGTNAACQSVSGQLSCLFNLPAPVGTLIYTVTIYNGTSVIAEGNVSFTTTNGATVSAPLTLSGTVSKIVLSVGAGVQGQSGSFPITVQAEDASGNTILGTYTSPITLSDTDASGQTSIVTSGTDSPAAGELVSSADTAALAYKGGSMSAAATIGASASGVSAPNVTTATFLPLVSALGASGTVTLGVTYYASNFTDNAIATPSPAPTSTTFPVAVATGATLGSNSNLVAVTGLSMSPDSEIPLSASSITYYGWSGTANGTAMGLAGFSDPGNTYVPQFTQLTSLVSLVETCVAPLPQLVVIPLTNWNVYGGSGTCTTTYTDTAGDTENYAYAANGSYTDTTNLVATGSDWAFYPGMSGTQTVTVDASGNLTYSINGVDSGAAGCSPCAGEVYGAGSLSVPAPTSGTATIPVSWTLPTTVAGPIVPTPAPTSVPNPWLAAGAPNGVIPNPLFSDTVTNKGSVTSLPTQCAAANTLLGSSPSLTETQENVVQADPMDTWLAFYTTTTIYHYYLNGVNEVCNEAVVVEDSFLDWGGGNNYSVGDEPPIWSFGANLSGALNYYSGVDSEWDSYYSDTYTYLTASSVLQAAARTRNMTEALPVASHALTAATYAGLRARLIRPRAARHTTRPSSFKWPGR